MPPRPSGTAHLLVGAADVFRSRSRLARGARLALSTAVGVSVLALVVFHASLLWNQIGDGRVLDSAVAVRWVLGALLLGALAALRRAGVPVHRGRRALVLWVLVALLHFSAAPPADLVRITGAGSQGRQVLVDLPTAAAATCLLAAALGLLWLVGARVRPHAARALGVGWIAAAGARTPILNLLLPSRAPPVLA